MDTPRRFPRTLSDAFPDVRASCIEHYKMPKHEWALYIVAVVAVIVIWRFA